MAHVRHHGYVFRLFRRALSYSEVGIATFLLDIGLIALLHHAFNVPYSIAITVGFLTSMSINYFACYRFIYKGTERNVLVGYAIFSFLAVVGIGVIVPTVGYLVEVQGLNVLLARTLVAMFIGTTEFVINTYFNFKVV